MYQNTNTVTRTREAVILQTNSVIRNTYFLLSLSLLFSVLTAWLGMVTNAPAIGLIALPISFGLLFTTQLLRNSSWGILSTFLFTGFMGYTLGPILNMTIQNFHNGTELVMASLGLTGIIFFALSAYALTTRKDFSYLGAFLMVVGCVGCALAFANIVFKIPVLQIGIAGIFTLLASGSILFETSQIINGGQRNYIMATISLYVSIYNLFVNLLQLLMVFAGKRDD